MKSIITTMIKTIATGAILALMIGFSSILAHAQDHRGMRSEAAGQDVIIGKKGQAHFTNAVKVGAVVLKPGMYQVQHLDESGEHVIIFKEMSMPAGYRMGNTPVGNEVARIKCKVEPVAKKAPNTKITLRTNAAGEKEIVEVQIAGEAFMHLM